MRKIFFSLIALALVTMPVTRAVAADYYPKTHEEGSNVVISGDQEYGNLYTAGSSLIVNSRIDGDLFGAGGSVNLASEVRDDVFLLSGNITLTGAVGGDVRAAGGNIAINGPVSGDLLIAGGTVTVSETASVAGDAWIAGGTVSLTNPVAGNLKIAGGEVFINSTVDGKVEIAADEKLVFGPQAFITGDITYYGKTDPIIQNGAQVSKIIRKEFAHKEKNETNKSAHFVMFFLFKMLVVFLTAWILLRFMKRRVDHMHSRFIPKFWSNLGIGFAGMILTPIVAIILMFTIIGTLAGAILFAWFVFVAMITGLFSVMMLGKTFEMWVKRRKLSEGLDHETNWLTVLWGVLVGGILCLIPVVGPLVIVGFYFATFGVLLRELYARLVK